MAYRNQLIGESVSHAILDDFQNPPTFLHRVPAYFYLYSLAFKRVQAELFSSLRGIWHIPEATYRASFKSNRGKGSDDALKPLGDMGFSGSTFFATVDGKYLAKSVPRHFEHSFFKHDLLLPYAEYMRQNPASLLVRITDFLECSQSSLGWLLGLAPSHHLVMENLKFGEKDDMRDVEWQSWDLKPMDYFFPERDVAGGALASEAQKSKLADEFEEKIPLSQEQAAAFRAQLQKDTALLAQCNAVDYSLFLLRFPAMTEQKGSNGPSSLPLEPPLVPPKPPTWRAGVRSADGKYIYRATVLDFFWAKHKIQAKAMTGLINAYNLVDRQGPMSVTTTSEEYRERFLGMCQDLVEVK